MDDTGGNNMDSGLHRNKLRLLIILFTSEISAGDFTASTQLSLCGIWSGQGFWVVLWGLSLLFASLPPPLHGCFHGSPWLWPPMASHPKTRLLALCSGQQPSLSLSLSLNLMESVGKWDGKCMVVWFSFEFLNFWFYFLFLSVDLVCEAC